MKKERSSKYKGVSYINSRSNGKDIIGWTAAIDNLNGRMWRKHTGNTDKSEREAAIAYDMKMIELGKEPVNILKRK